MNTRMRELAVRREALVARARLQRALAGEACARLRTGLHIADRGWIFLRALKRNPMAVGLAAAAVTLLIATPRQTLKWLGYSLTAYSIFKRASRLLNPTHSD